MRLLGHEKAIIRKNNLQKRYGLCKSPVPDKNTPENQWENTVLILNTEYVDKIYGENYAKN